LENIYEKKNVGLDFLFRNAKITLMEEIKYGPTEIYLFITIYQLVTGR